MKFFKVIFTEGLLLSRILLFSHPQYYNRFFSLHRGSVYEWLEIVTALCLTLMLLDIKGKSTCCSAGTRSGFYTTEYFFASSRFFYTGGEVYF